jgi:peptidyl-prolyl cis-trans isomerase D
MEGDQIPPLDSGKEGYYWVSIDAVTPAERRPLEEVRSEIVSLWKDRKRTAELETLAQRLADRGNAGESFDTLAGEFGRSVLTMPGIQRHAQNDTFSRVAVTAHRRPMRLRAPIRKQKPLSQILSGPTCSRRL